MKKILFTMAAIISCVTMSFAQTSFIATLQHEGEFTHYYGAGALTSAYNAATEGDIITLSPGTFSSPGTIDKGITLRGTGFDASPATYVSGGVTFCSTDSNRVVTVEGIIFNNECYVQNNASGTGQGTLKFIKNTFNGLSATAANTYSTERGSIVRIYNCAIYNVMRFYGNTYPDFLIYNSFVEDPGWARGVTHSETITSFVNCVIRWKGYSYYYNGGDSYPELSHCLNYFNCIFNTAFSNPNNMRLTSFPNTATCYNCLSINHGSLFRNLVSGGNNKTAGSASDIFVTYTSEYNAGETFELTDAAKEAYIGTDSTQIGMQGGNYPFTTTVQYPVITKFNVNAQTNKAGMLNVEVEVDGK